MTRYEAKCFLSFDADDKEAEEQMRYLEGEINNALDELLDRDHRRAEFSVDDGQPEEVDEL